MKRLVEKGASPELRAFLQLAYSNGAELDALTDQIRQELIQRSLYSRLRLVIR